MGSVDPKRLSNFIFAGLFALSIVLFSRILLPFVMPLLLGAFLVVLMMPVQDYFTRKLKNRVRLSAALSTSVVFLVVVVPLAVIAYLVAREVLGVMGYAKALLDQVDLRQELLNSLPRGVRRYVRLDPRSKEVERAVLGVISGGAGMLTGMVKASTEFAINLFLLVVALYYFFIDGRRLVNEGARLLPIDRRYFETFAKEFKDVAYAIIYGNTLTAIIQGALGFVGMWFAGVPHAPIWGVAMVVVALIPIGGTALIWGPVGIALIVSGNYTGGIFLLAWGTFLVSTIDNVIRPRLCGARMALHPLLVFLSMFGGLAVFGMMGLLVGPLIASIFMAMVRIYRRDFLLPRATPGLPASSIVTP
ncbi:MAG: AI-2E family transporter [Myxococcota bacterium]|nr:AI-2E family transporter [Myxococcota bacterium]